MNALPSSIERVTLPNDTTVTFSFQRKALVLERGDSILAIQLNLSQIEVLREYLGCILFGSTLEERVMSISRDPQSPQPLPVDSGQPRLHDLLSSDIQARKEHGARKYGQALQAENGRNFTLDIYEEILDAAVYLKGELEENKKLAEVLDYFLNDFNLGDKVYDVREKITDLPEGIDTAWEHPKVLKFSENVTYLQGVLKRLKIGME